MRSQSSHGRSPLSIACGSAALLIAASVGLMACAAADHGAGSESGRGFSFQRLSHGPSLLGANVKDHVGSPFSLDGVTCPDGMADIGGRFCIDRYEATLVEELESGAERPFPFFSMVDGKRVRAVSRANVFPQGYISGKEAQAACQASGKRLCKATEWTTACRGPKRTNFPYGDRREARRCNDHGKSPRAQIHRVGSLTNQWEEMNDPSLNQLPGTVSKTGEHEGCVNDWGVHDMVGNLHEWVDDPNGTFLGGYYLDTSQNGEGCGYATKAHSFGYHDYSTGFRCCRDLEL